MLLQACCCCFYFSTIQTAIAVIASYWPWPYLMSPDSMCASTLEVRCLLFYCYMYLSVRLCMPVCAYGDQRERGTVFLLLLLPPLSPYQAS